MGRRHQPPWAVGKPGGDSSAGCVAHGKGWPGGVLPPPTDCSSSQRTKYLGIERIAPILKRMKTEAQRGEMISLRSQASRACPASELGVSGRSVPARVGNEWVWTAL